MSYRNWVFWKTYPWLKTCSMEANTTPRFDGATGRNWIPCLSDSHEPSSPFHAYTRSYVCVCGCVIIHQIIKKADSDSVPFSVITGSSYYITSPKKIIGHRGSPDHCFLVNFCVVWTCQNIARNYPWESKGCYSVGPQIKKETKPGLCYFLVFWRWTSDGTNIFIV